MRNALRLVLGLGGAAIFGGALMLACSDDTDISTTTKEAGSDGSLEASDLDGGADTAPPFDGGFVLKSFDKVLATELCKSLARCCYGTATPGDGGADGGTFDNDACVAALTKVGFQDSRLGIPVEDGGMVNVVLDQVKADDCLNKIKAISCDLPGTEYTAARAACFGVYTGKFGAGLACKGSYECQRGFFCKNIVTDGGTGSCTAIRTVGGPCGDNPNSTTEYEESCSYRGGGDTGNYCKFHDFEAGADIADAAAWNCAAAAVAPAQCYSSTWCKDSVCDPDTFICRTPDKIFDNSCKSFLKQ